MGWRVFAAIAAIHLLHGGTARAQTLGDTLPGAWREGGNAAGLGTAGLRGEGRIRFFGGTGGGDYRRPQSPERTGLAGFTAQADRAAGGWTMLGAFAYTRRADHGVRWSNVADPYAGSPYVWADSTGGTWHRDDVRLRAALGSPRRAGRLAAGLALEYEVGQGARQNDPAPLFRRRVMSIVSGVAWTIAPRHTVGVTGTAEWAREDGEVGFGSAQDPFVYHLRGLGTFDRTQLLAAARVSVGRRLGGGVQYQGDAGPWRLGAAIDGSASRDSVRDGVATPTFGGSWTQTRGGFRGSARRAADGVSMELRASADVDRGRGTDPVFRAVNVVDEGWSAGVGMEAWAGRDRSVSARRLNVRTGARSINRRDVVARTEWSAVSVDADAAASLRRGWGRGGAIRGEIRGGVSRPIRSTLTSSSDSPLIPILVQPDYAVHAAAIGRAGVSLRAEPPDGRLRGPRLSLGVDADGTAVLDGRIENPASGRRGQLSLFLEILQ